MHSYRHVQLQCWPPEANIDLFTLHEQCIHTAMYSYNVGLLKLLVGKIGNSVLEPSEPVSKLYPVLNELSLMVHCFILCVIKIILSMIVLSMIVVTYDGTLFTHTVIYDGSLCVFTMCNKDYSLSTHMLFISNAVSSVMGHCFKSCLINSLFLTLVCMHHRVRARV